MREAILQLAKQAWSQGAYYEPRTDKSRQVCEDLAREGLLIRRTRAYGQAVAPHHYLHAETLFQDRKLNTCQICGTSQKLAMTAGNSGVYFLCKAHWLLNQKLIEASLP